MNELLARVRRSRLRIGPTRAQNPLSGVWEVTLQTRNREFFRRAPSRVQARERRALVGCGAEPREENRDILGRFWSYSAEKSVAHHGSLHGSHRQLWRPRSPAPPSRPCRRLSRLLPQLLHLQRESNCGRKAPHRGKSAPTQMTVICEGQPEG